LLIQRKTDPFAGLWAFPGGFVEEKETLEQSAKRELQEETGISRLYLEQLYTFGDPGRDPRGHTVTVAYYALVKLSDHAPQGGGRCEGGGLVPGLQAAQAGVRSCEDFESGDGAAAARRCGISRLALSCSRRSFTLSQLQRLYEIVLERPLDKRNFRKKILGMGLLIDLEETQKDVAHRAAQALSV